MANFLWGSGGAKLTPEEIAIQRALFAKKRLQGVDVSPVASPLQGMARVVDALGDRYQESQLNDAAAENATYNQSQAAPIMDALYGGITGTSSPVASALAAGADPAMGNPPSSNGSTFSPFIDTVKGAITNPYGLAAVASTGRAESGWSPVNASRSWADPSQSGDPGTAGGILSWRGPRLSALQAFAKANGETGNGSPETQAKFFLQEDPNLVASLNGAKSVQEAQSAINRAWAFAGYDKPGGESSRRLGYASAYLPQFQKTAQPNSAAAAIEAQAPVAYVDPVVSASAYVPPSQGEGFDAGRFDNNPASGNVPQIYSAQSDFAPSLPEPRSVSAPPQAASVQPVQVAQNMPQVPRALIAQSLAVMQDPRATAQTKSVAQALLERQQSYNETAQKQALAEQQRQQDIARRQAVAQQTGINPAYAQDPDIWKAAAGNVFAAPSTSTVGANVIDNRTGKPIYQGTPEAPVSVQEFEYGQKNPDYFTRQESLRRSGAPTTEGAIPAGYQANRDANGRVISVSPLAGSPAAFEEAQRGKATDKQVGQRSTSTDVVTNAGVRAVQALSSSGMPATGTIGRLMSAIPESNAAEIRRQVATLKANASASTIQAMREASPTGAALGGTSDKDVELLANKAGSLDPDSPNFDRDVKDYVKTQLEIIHGPEAGRKIFDGIDWTGKSTVPTDLPGVTIRRKGQ